MVQEWRVSLGFNFIYDCLFYPYPVLGQASSRIMPIEQSNITKPVSQISFTFIGQLENRSLIQTVTNTYVFLIGLDSPPPNMKKINVGLAIKPWLLNQSDCT